MKKVSFDFDDTLSFKSTQEYAKKLIDEGIEIHITTSRYEDPSRYPFKADHNDLFKVAEELNIPKEHIHFTNFEDKYKFLTEKSCDDFRDFVWHLDDNDQEIFFIMQNTNIKGIWSLSGDYEHTCNNLLGLTHLNK